jgi:pyruvate formate-lyase/glycerol dehydratase family glycyl radical enzyme
MGAVTVPVGNPIPARPQRLKQSLLQIEREMCVERAALVTDAYRANEADPIVLRRAKALATVLREMTLGIANEELIVGNLSDKRRSPSVFPEYSLHWVEYELEAFETRAHNRLRVPAEAKRVLWDIYPYWRGKTVCERLRAARTPELQRAVDHGLIANPHEYTGLAHVALDVPRVLRDGLEGVQAAVAARLAALDKTSPTYLQERVFLDALLVVCSAAMAFAQRYAAVARAQANASHDPVRRDELLRIAAVCDRAPAKPACSFWEALQTVWFLQVIPQIECNGFSITPGRFDQYMLPYYERDVAAGALSPEQGQELLECLWIKFSEVARVDDRGMAELDAGYASGQNLCIGGRTATGHDSTNALTYMCLAANEHLQLPQPNFTVRLHKETPAELVNAVVRVIARGNGMPQLLNDELIIPAMLNKGIPLAEAREYIPVGCDEITVAGMWGRCNGGYVNLAKALELALTDGRCRLTGDQVGPPTGSVTEIGSFPRLLEAVYRQVDYAVTCIIAEANTTDHIHAEVAPLPFESLLVPGCIESARDVTVGGARYNFTGPVGVGSATVGDSLAAVKRFVFDEKAISLADLGQMLDADFAGHEVWQHRLINRAPKFGNDDDFVDELVVAVTNRFFDGVEKGRNPRGGGMMPALYSVTSHVGAGKRVGATPDGRKAGAPLSDGLSPTYGRDVKGPTAALRSIAKVDLVRAPNGVIVNQRLAPGLLATDTGRLKMSQLLRSFVDAGGFHWQFNVVPTATLLGAQEHPEQYRDLVVRVAGYSAFFVDLSRAAQDAIIQRCAAEF